ncbi:reverse transcriptase domain-containing protein [Leptolyngbya ohadii]|uniref:reverse transcriptase domain-containing protein n=1 Tax=Leptolyngbya ohadii TaxID=1962290 RepID=UPI000B5A0061|nr:reverse transcriptase domain-containing protein [Leptolyngbya ohadii]
MFRSRIKRSSTLLLCKNCDELKQEFLSLKTAKDIATLLEVPYYQLAYHLYKVAENEKYREFSIPKKSGDSRTITAPAKALKILQRKLSQVLYSVYEPKKPVHGFVPARSILTNAKQHSHKRFVLNIDLKDFFDSIHFGRVKGIFIKPPCNLPEEVATILARICCHSGKLPQGAPTSPVVSNMVCARLDRQLRLLAEEFRCTYTRYADDITFSTTMSDFPKEIAFANPEGDNLESLLGERLILTIWDNDFEINENKIRLQHKGQHQSVTGLTVNQFPNVKRAYVRKISSMLHAWDKFGLASVQQRYVEKHYKESGKFNKEIPSFQEVLRGKINFLGMIRGKDDEIYRKYLTWYRNLSVREIPIDLSQLDSKTQPSQSHPTDRG